MIMEKGICVDADLKWVELERCRHSEILPQSDLTFVRLQCFERLHLC